MNRSLPQQGDGQVNITIWIYRAVAGGAKSSALGKVLDRRRTTEEGLGEKLWGLGNAL